NPGSSSLKTGFFRFPEELALPLDAQAGTVGVAIQAAGGSPIDAVGVRVVHGGSRFVNPAVVDDAVLAGIRELEDVAPLHNPLAVRAIEEVRRELPGRPIVAVFDTAFHRTMPPVAFTYAVPSELGLRRYGFHGISYAYVSRRLAALSGGSRFI